MPYPQAMANFARVYGDVCAYATGRASIVQVTDLDVVKAITLKDHRKCNDRPWFPFISSFMRQGIIWASGETWSSSRASLAPLFHPQGLKLLHPAMASAVDDMMDYLRRHVDDRGGGTGVVMDMAAVCDMLAVEAISRTAYSLSLGLFEATPNTANLELASALKDKLRLASADLEGSISMQVALIFPTIGFAMRRILQHVPGTRDHR
eukprot:jgi/Mesvir1/9575/Mv16831-RA.1